jgi:hypothetical protein
VLSFFSCYESDNVFTVLMFIHVLQLIDKLTLKFRSILIFNALS